MRPARVHFHVRRRLKRPLAALALLIALTACQSGAETEAPTSDSTVATFGTATFDDAQFE